MKISHIQLFWTIAIMELGMTLLMTITDSLQAAKQDAWISMALAGGISLLVAFISTRLALLYPEQTLVEASETILGSALGKLVVIVYLVQWYTIIPIVLRQFTDLIESMFLQTTPRFPIIGIMIALMIYAIYAGKLQGIGRLSEILGPIIFLMVFVVLIANVGTVHYRNLLPVLKEQTFKEVFSGSLAPASYLGHSVSVIMLVPFLTDARRGMKYVIFGVLLSSIILFWASVMILLTINPHLAAHMWYPFFEMTKKIQIGFVENWDVLAVVIWISSVFIKLTVYMFIASYGTAQFLRIDNWKVLVWILAPIFIAFAIYPESVVESTNHYLKNYWIPFVLPVNMIGLPLLLWIVGSIRKKWRPTIG